MSRRRDYPAIPTPTPPPTPCAFATHCLKSAGGYAQIFAATPLPPAPSRPLPRRLRVHSRPILKKRWDNNHGSVFSGADDGPTLRQCNMCSSKFHHMCIVEEAARNGWPEAEEEAKTSEGSEEQGEGARCARRVYTEEARAATEVIVSANMPSTPSEVDVTPIPVGPLRETQIHKNDKKLLAFYAAYQNFMLSGVVTEVRYVVGSEKDPDIDTPGKNTKAEAKAMVALYKITWNHTRFQRDEPWITARLFYKGEPTYERGTKLPANLLKSEDESHDLTERDNKFIANSSFDEETKSDEETNDGSLAPQDDDGSEDEWSEYVDRGWKKHGHYDATEDFEGLEDVEWTCGGHYAGPTDLYEHEDNKDDTPVDELRISEEFKHLFKDPVKDFLGFMPLEFWKIVTLRTNAKAVALQAAHPKGYVGGREFKKSIELVEVMKFVGLLIMMSVVQGGEYSLYWSKPSMSFLMPPTENFGRVMPIDRFKQLRACITFNDVVEPADPLWRIRPLINLLKASFKNFVVAGREISVDEACIPCRSSYARALIVYNPKKPLGKYHFRIYTAACATTCKVDPDDGAEHPRDEVKPSALRQHVIDITKQWEGSHRVINMDNWYSSVQLCLTLLKMGMYCRGTVRSHRAHNPRFGMFDKKQIKSVMRVVNMLSTADATAKSYVHRRIGSETRQQECLSLVGLYNKYMQGVDRHDHLRERFSIASGASF
ncbi:hypothetical protein H257_00591 [Aphanomyces astaci]|uniref:PiggyBac transposable element-derived protein domain-containing protein n=1 Tax=Aphanomyces astaci TaxID=112090 RepID=W4HB45_APHAT|nr:hypothetical protein H257_00591 [Aphanomyces astaci]ETV89235.1 hypothetical protein H257_00591 [Aphanomyces astaci]|eukprot:XP_009821635.1 hypothetical protein H257_00591 [Aphanomyces astaci]